MDDVAEQMRQRSLTTHKSIGASKVKWLLCVEGKNGCFFWAFHVLTILQMEGEEEQSERREESDARKAKE